MALTPTTVTLTAANNSILINRVKIDALTNQVIAEATDTYAQSRSAYAAGRAYEQNVTSTTDKSTGVTTITGGWYNFLRTYFQFTMSNLPSANQIMNVSSMVLTLTNGDPDDMMGYDSISPDLMRYMHVGAVNQTGMSGKIVDLHSWASRKTWATGSSGSNYARWSSMATSSSSTLSSYAMSTFDATPFQSFNTVAGNVAGAGNVYQIDMLPYLRQYAPSNVTTALGPGLGSSASSIPISFAVKMRTESPTSSREAILLKKEASITYTYTINTAPSAPVPTEPANNSTVSGTDVPFSATFVDQAGDTPTKFDIAISTASTFYSTVYAKEIIDSTDPLNCTIPLSTFQPNSQFFWRIRSYDSLGVVSPWSATKIFNTPSSTGWSPSSSAPTSTTSPRNKYRLEFYGLAADLSGFYPSPSAVIFDAKSIGVSQTVNASGEFFFTIQSDHPQIANIVPQKTFWRACRWDERKSFYRVIGEGMITNSVITPHEVIFYGTDKVAMLNRIVISADKIASSTSHTGTIATIHDDITRRTSTASITGVVTAATNNDQIAATAHLIKIGDSLVVTGVTSGTASIAGTRVRTVSGTSTNSITIPKILTETKVITAAVRNSPATGQVTYTTSEAHGYITGQVLTAANISAVTTYNFTNLTATVLTPTTFWVTLAAGTGTPTFAGATVRTEPTAATVSLAKRITDMGWTTNPSVRFSDYLVTNSAYSTATTSKTVQIAGNRAADALASVADILMQGTTNKVILENPNIGQPASKIDTMEVGLRYRHLQLADVVKPAWWFQYGVNLKGFTVQDNLDKMASKAIVINRNLDQGTSSLYNNGSVDETLYAEYGLVEAVEIINEERNDIEFAKQLAYNLHPDRLFTIESDVIPNTISPFADYAVGDDITIYIVHNRANVRKDLTIVGQRWIGNSDGAEYMLLSFAPRITQSFLDGNKNKNGNGSGRGRGGDTTDDTIPDDSRGSGNPGNGRGRGGGGGGDWSGGDNPIDPTDPGEPTDPGDVWYDGPWS